MRIEHACPTAVTGTPWGKEYLAPALKEAADAVCGTQTS